MRRMHLSLGLIVQPLSVHLAQIQQPCAFYEEAKVSYWGCAYIFWLDKQIPKNAVALTRQRLAAKNNGTLYEDLCTFTIIPLSVLLRMCNVSDKICRENQNTFCFE
jgi:hypothetical protein